MSWESRVLELWAAASQSAADMDRLNNTADLIGASRRLLISRTSKTAEGGERTSCNLDWLLAYLERQSA